MIDRQALLTHLNSVLQPDRFKDVAPNGLQVEGRREIQRVVSGVSATVALIEAAVAAQADAIFVHHGLFWRGQDPRVTGWMRQRLSLLLAHNVNLFAYHLPLDAHPQWGNNAQLGALLGLQSIGNFGEQQLGWLGEPTASSMVHYGNAANVARHVEQQLGRPVTLIEGGGDRAPRRIAWCSGGAQSYFEAAIAAGADLFITGEISEQHVHFAREMGVSYIACGHHASERYGAPALMQQVAAELGLTHQFIEVDSPA